MPVINVRITLWLFILLVYRACSEEASTTKIVDNADSSKSRLSTVLPYQSLNDDERIAKDNLNRSLVLQKPLTQTQSKREELKETVEKRKRCGTHQKNRLLSSTKKDRNNRVTTTDKSINLKTLKENSNGAIKDAKNSLEKSKVTAKRTLAKAPENEIFLRIPADDLNTKDVIINLKSQERANKCNTEKCICRCKEENCRSSSKENYLGTSSFSEINESERPNNRKLKIFENTKPDNLQQKLLTSLDESSHESSLPNLINQFPIQSYQDKINFFSIPILYGVIPNVPPYVVKKEGKYINVGIPFTSFEDRPDSLVEKNQPIDHKNPCTCLSLIDKQENENSTPAASSSENYVDVTITTETTNSKPDNPISQTEKNEEYNSKLITEIPNVDSSINSDTEINLVSDYSTDTIKASTTVSSFNLNEITPKTENFTNQIEKNSDNNLSKFETSSEDYSDAKDASSFIIGINDETLIDIEECIQLYGRNVCVLSATSPKMFPKPAVQKMPFKYSTVKIPEYITKTSVEKETTLNSIDHLDKLKTTNSHFASESFNGIDESNDDLINKYTELTTKLNNEASFRESHQFPESAKQTSKPEVKYDEIKSFNKIINTHTSTNPIIDETTKSEKIKLEKSKSQTIKLSLNPNTEEIESTTLNEGFHYSDANFEKKISQEPSSIETTTIKSNIENNFKKEAEKNIVGTTVRSEEISQERPTTMEYFDDKKSSKSSCKEDVSRLEPPKDSSTNKLPFCDNTLLLNSIRKIINDFALDPRLNKIKDLDEDILQAQGKNLLPEILQIPNLKNILSVPRIENTIVEKVKDVLSRVTSISREKFTNNWSHGIIKNTLHSILDALSGIRHKHPSMTLEERQFKNGQWGTKLVTLAPISKQQLSKEIPETLRDRIKSLLGSPAIASQADNRIVQNIIVESVKSNLTNNGDEQIDDSIIQVLNNILQALKNSKGTDAPKKNNQDTSDKDVDITFSQNMPANNHEIEIEREKEATSKPTVKMEENIEGFKQIKNINVQDNTKKKLVEPKITYHKAISQNNPKILAILEPNFTTGQYVNNYRIDEETVQDTTIANFLQETLPNYAQESDGMFAKNVGETKNIEENVKHTSNEYTSNEYSTEINPLIILERIKFNLPPTKYYSPKILKYVTNHQIDDKSIKITTASTNFKQETSTNYAQILQNEANAKNVEDEIKDTSAASRDNFISSLANKNVLESQENSQENCTVDNIIKTQEITEEVQPMQTYAKATHLKTKEAIVSSTESFLKNDNESSQLFPSSAAPDNISELLNSQLYYVSDGIKLPLEITKLEDGSYALSISKNICEQILTKKCPCCVPLQGYVVRSLENPQQKENMQATTSTTLEIKHQDNIKDHHLAQPLSTVAFSTLTRRNALRIQKSKEREEKINSNHLQKKTDDNLEIFSIPVADFVKKYNLIRNFNIEETEHKYSNKSEEEQPVIRKTNELFHESDDDTTELNNLKNIREKKNIPNINSPTFPTIRRFLNLRKNSKELGGRKGNAEINQTKISPKSKLRQANNIQNINIVQKIKSENQERIKPVLKEINTSEESKKSSDGIKWTKISNIAEGNYIFFIYVHMYMYKCNVLNNMEK
ncbi:hypothetical protein PUN28_007759 [Cardiocondyla obscurior]|uniref:Uncharacterized protein n=1 Tax=Cardiocondyla obscurior TaxID=286306 RepID=A0AAW2G060_9HYME